MREQYGTQEQPLPSQAAALISDRDALQKWLNVARSGTAEQGGESKPKLVIVSLSGGAARSAFWSAVVLERLEAEIPGFGKHVRIITGASGGMVAGAYCITRQRDARNGDQTASPLTGMIPLDSITPVAAHIAMRDLWESLLPVRMGVDRGIVLERDWKAIDFPLRELKPFEEEGMVPSIILSPMMIEDGRRLLISKLNLWSLTHAEGSEVTARDAGTQRCVYSLSAVEFFRLFPSAVEFHLATGVRMSASFPYVSPAVSLPTAH